MKNVLFVTAISIALTGNASAAHSDAIQSGVSKAVQSLQVYSTTRSLDDLRKSVYLMQSAVDIGNLNTTDFIAQRRIIVGGWAQILKAIDGSYDPTFDPNARIGCPVPPGVDPPCSDPSVIKDPVARATYTKQLNAYHTYLQRFADYQHVQQVDNLAMVSLRMELDQLRKVAPVDAGPDFAALDQILQQAGINDSRRSAIDTMFYGEAH